MAQKLRLEGIDLYHAWFNGIKDKTTRARIRHRLAKAEATREFGDIRGVGEGVYELRFHFGPGWRIYIFQGGPNLYWVVWGGTKDTQQEDVIIARKAKREMEDNHARN